MRPVRALLFVGALGSCSSHPQQASPWPGCYAFTWPDSLRWHRLPSTARLDAQRDTSMPPPAPKLFVMSPLSPPSTSPHISAHLNQAWWRPVGPDSLNLTIVDPFNIQWEISLGSIGDSLVGVATGMDGDAAWGPFDASARRIPCPR